MMNKINQVNNTLVTNIIDQSSKMNYYMMNKTNQVNNTPAINQINQVQNK